MSVTYLICVHLLANVKGFLVAYSAEEVVGV